MSGGNNSNIGAIGFVAPHPLKGSLLQYAQNFDLHIQRHIANFIEK